MYLILVFATIPILAIGAGFIAATTGFATAAADFATEPIPPTIPKTASARIRPLFMASWAWALLAGETPKFRSVSRCCWAKLEEI